jgi:hypothetical protein
MKTYIKYLTLLLLLISFQSEAQTTLPAGYPDRSPSFDVLPGFINPPKGYGEVPFYWWQGDTLTRERLLWQLDQLKGKAISSLQINYSHRDSGGISYGLSNPSRPALFTDEWWTLFKWFAKEAQKRDMSVSLSDYTLGIGQGFCMDDAIKQNPELNGSIIKSYTKIISGSGNLKFPENLLSLTAFRLNEDSSFIINTRINLLSQLKNSSLLYDFGNETWKVTGVFQERLIPSFDPMNPQSGKAYNQNFFERFEKALSEKGTGELNFFFSDELNFRVSDNLWNNYFAEEFRKRKGYDIIPYLDALFVDIGSITPKIRLDYNDVVVSLSEENFFKPVYQWHQERGMIFGCDHGGRGKSVAEFGDYFRTQRWNQGPGSDQPLLQKDIIKAKVASSIAHLYGRPRVWLEGFHSSGWGTSSANVTDAIFADFVAGYNLLSFHGLYYSTMGGWWEWAPPDNHFRMPYWSQIDPLMKCIQRLSYLLSQGYHSCDVAIIYPAEPVIAGMDGKKSVSLAFETGEKLYDKGIDFDFIDFESLGRSEVKDQELIVSGEKYKVLIVPSMRAIRFSSLKKIEEFKRSGGIVVNIGELPEATEKQGLNDPEIAKLVSDLFSGGQNIIQCENAKTVSSAISGKYPVSFKILTDPKARPYIMHKIIGKRDIYAIYNLPSGTRCFFRAKGNVQLWNPWNGEISSLSKFATQTNEGTEVIMPLSEKEIQIIVFDQNSTKVQNVLYEEKIVREYNPDNTWEFELKPSLDNRWGDFQLPAENGLIGAQVRQLYLTEDKIDSKEKPFINKNRKMVTCGFEPQFLKLGPTAELPSDYDLKQLSPQMEGDVVSISGKKYKWNEYAFSWQQGVEGDYGHQGYHGLKGEMYDNFIRLGAIKDVKMSMKRVPEPAGNYYILYTKVISPSDGNFELLTGDIKPHVLFVNDIKTDIGTSNISLKKGANKILLVYNQACETYFVVRKNGIPYPEKQAVSMRWYKDYAVLPFDYPGKYSSGFFEFQSAPGLVSLTFSAYGKVTTWIDGAEIQTVAGIKLHDGLTEYSLNLKEPKPSSSSVGIKIEYQPGHYGAGSIPQYFKEVCGTGKIILGDWSKIDGLKSYSGGAWYRKSIQINADDLKYKLEIDLGDLVSSAEVFINDKSAGIRLAPPWIYDITSFAKEGENKLEILVYNTLANNYVSIPTRYRGDIKSGLIGPVTLRVLSSMP